jgi:hypothetical protein
MFKKICIVWGVCLGLGALGLAGVFAPHHTAAIPSFMSPEWTKEFYEKKLLPICRLPLGHPDRMKDDSLCPPQWRAGR